jgi:diketogulonate reductase-like aldo/keto reductase
MKVNNSAEHIKEYIEGTIQRLGSTPDLYYLHRIEPGRSLEESIGALNDLKKAGKCRYIGLSECSAETLRKACAGMLTSMVLCHLLLIIPFFDNPQSRTLTPFKSSTARGLQTPSKTA